MYENIRVQFSAPFWAPGSQTIFNSLHDFSLFKIIIGDFAPGSVAYNDICVQCL